MSDEKKLPEISPFIFPALLAAFGLWCFYDGWLTTDPEMQEHLLFNRVLSAVLLPWAVFDFWRVRRRQRRGNRKEEIENWEDEKGNRREEIENREEERRDL